MILLVYFLRVIVIISATFFRLKILHSGIWDKIERLKCFAENGFKNGLKNPCANGLSYYGNRSFV